MKVKLFLRQINDLFKTHSTLDRSKTASITSQRDDKLIIFDYSARDSILELKGEIGKCVNESPDSIELMYRDNDKSPLVELNDVELISSTLVTCKTGHHLTNKYITEATEEDEEVIPVYYKVVLYPVHIRVDLNQNKIEKITKTLSASCSIYMLKHRIEEKFNSEPGISKANQKLFLISLKNKSQLIDIEMEVNKEYNNKSKLSTIIKEIELSKGVSFGCMDFIHLNFLLVLNMKDTLKMGLNFNFNYFKNLSQVNFNTNAPTHRECSDGLNMFVYCRNSQCPIFNEMFVRNVGYGCFDVIREILRTKCPQCRSSSMVEVRNIGMINATWVYNGVLNSKKTSNFDGDGSTMINNRLYLLSEAKISSVFSKLLIKITPHKAKEDLPGNETRKNKDKAEEEESESLFDSIPLCLDKKYMLNDDSVNNSKASCKGSDVNESVVICNASKLNAKKDVKLELSGMNSRVIRTDLDDKGAYCMNGCLLQKGALPSSSNAVCAIF